VGYFGDPRQSAIIALVIEARIRIFLIGVFIVATIGLGAVFFLGFKYFTHQGNDLDWIFSVGGLFAVLWLLSAFGVAVCTTVIEIANRKKKARLLP
jgi:hypothetical protein